MSSVTGSGTSEGGPEDRLGGCPNGAAGSSAAVYADSGTFAVLIDSFDPDERTLSIDVVQWLVGQEADDAYEAETGDGDGVPNDYFVVNENPLVRTVPVDEDVVLRMVWLRVDGSPDVSGGSLADLPGYLADEFAGTIWWATLVDGVIVELCEQFVP